jgi:RNA polymerase sigma factor (sigma-70 family)
MGLALRAIGQKHSATEQHLVAAVRKGDDRAFEELFSRYRSRITGYVLGMVRDHARAEDITQEVFLSALRRLRDSERPIAFKPWIYEIARNACIDEFRRTRRASEISLNTDDESPDTDRRLISKQPTPDVAMENKQRLEALRDAFRGLPENQHRILVMREFEGLSYAEISSRLGMTRPMVESTLFRARRRLGEEYQELASGRRCERVCEVVDRADAHTIRVLGVRARRQVSLHLSHCEDCRRYARLAGADESLFRAPTFGEKVAALLPFGWFGRRFAGFGGSKAKAASSASLAKPAAHGFIARHIPGATQYLGPIGSSAVLGRVAAAVLVLAAAGGGYEGVTLNNSAPTVHNAAAAISRAAVPSGKSATRSGAAAPVQPSVASVAASLRQSPQGLAEAAKVGAGVFALAAARPGHGGSAGASGHGGGPGKSAGGPSGSSPSAAPSTGSSSAGSAHHGLLAGTPAGGALRHVLAPITSHVPSVPKHVSVPTIHVPSTSKAALPPPPALPNPQNAVGQAGQAVNKVVGGAGKVLGGLTGH